MHREPKPLVFLGDTLVVNANAKGGSLVVEALDADGKIIEGFAHADCVPITTDSVRHVMTWKGNQDCHLLQGRPIKLHFHLKNAKLYSFEPRFGIITTCNPTTDRLATNQIVSKPRGA